VIADITRGTGRYSLALGIAGSAVGVGAALSTLLAGYLFDHFGRGASFLSLAGIAALGAALVLTLMPETRPKAAGPKAESSKTENSKTENSKANSPKAEASAVA
jgi:MFS family permease